jgi:putative heme-binding domain-containing protein
MRYLILLMAPVLLAQQDKMPAQAERGQKLFFESTKGTNCGTCHAMAGKGTAVGPDLTRLARINPRGIVTAILATRTQYVVNVQTKAGAAFPGMKVNEEGTATVYYDLSKTPPEQVKVEKADVRSVQDNASWKHPPESTGYSKEQLADIIAYIRWVGFGDTKGVSPGDL